MFACCALFMTQLLWFKLFGCFIAMLICSSVITAMVGMMALLAAFGPDEGVGMIEFLSRKREATGDGMAESPRSRAIAKEDAAGL